MRNRRAESPPPSEVCWHPAPGTPQRVLPLPRGQSGATEPPLSGAGQEIHPGRDYETPPRMWKGNPAAGPGLGGGAEASPVPLYLGWTITPPPPGTTAPAPPPGLTRTPMAAAFEDEAVSDPWEWGQLDRELWALSRQDGGELQEGAWPPRVRWSRCLGPGASR